MVLCKICQKDFENNKGLSYHVSQVHKEMFSNYLVKYFYEGKWPLCACGCGEEVSFFGGKFTKFIKSHGIIGIKRSEETKRKISKVQIGKILSEEHKSKIGAGVKNKFSTDKSAVEKIRKKLSGKLKTEEHRKNISETRKRKISSGEIIINRDKISESITQRYLDGGFEWSVGQYTSKKSGAQCNYRSSWEKTLMEILDEDPRVSSWSYEPFSIPYEFEGVSRRYIPDFLVTLLGRPTLVEVKPPPLEETPLNEAKRAAALQFCQNNGWDFIRWSPTSPL
jgi:hypothetical protein